MPARDNLVSSVSLLPSLLTRERDWLSQVYNSFTIPCYPLQMESSTVVPLFPSTLWACMQAMRKSPMEEPSVINFKYHYYYFLSKEKHLMFHSWSSMKAPTFSPNKHRVVMHLEVAKRHICCKQSEHMEWHLLRKTTIYLLAKPENLALPKLFSSDF